MAELLPQWLVGGLATDVSERHVERSERMQERPAPGTRHAIRTYRCCHTFHRFEWIETKIRDSKTGCSGCSRITFGAAHAGK